MGKTLNTFLNNVPKEEVLFGKGQYLYTKNKKKYLDFTCGGTSNCVLGFNNNFVIKNIKDQLNKISNIDYKLWIDENRQTLSDLLIKNSSKNLNRVFYSGQSGAEACEAALMLSYQFFYEKGYKKKDMFISRNESYHGITMLAQTAGERKNLSFFSPLYSKKNIKINPHDPLREKYKNETDDQYLERSLNEFKRTIKRIGSERIFAFVGEPIMGQLQGDTPPLKNYWKNIKKICIENQIHLIMDEVYAGPGICGKYNCFKWDDFEPDFLLLGKTLGAGYIPLSVVLLNDKIEKIIKNNSGRIGFSTTHQGHSLGVSAALAVQKFILNNNKVDHAKKMGNYLMDNLNNELSNIDIIRCIQGRGLRFSVFYETNNNANFSKKLLNNLKYNHNILLDIKWHRAGFRPSFIVDKKTSDFVIDKFVLEIKNLSKNMKFKKIYF